MDHPDHPFASIFPLLEGDEFAALTADIAAHGLREPIVLTNGTILDGRNRYRACKAAAVKPRFTVYDGDDPKAFVVSLNMHRRHLTESQRATVAGKLSNLEQGGDRRSDQTANLQFEPVSARVTVKQAAEMLNVSERIVHTARKVLDEGIPELVRAVEKGKITVSAAAEVAKLHADTQREIAAQPKLPTAKEARKIAREKGISVPSRGGKLQDGRSPKEEKTDHEANQKAGALLHPLEEINSIGMSPIEYFKALNVPRFGRYLDDDVGRAWNKAWPWFEEFNKIWRAHHAA